MLFVVIEITALCSTLVFLFIIYSKWAHQYWTRRNVPQIEPDLIWGNLDSVFKGKPVPFSQVTKVCDELRRRKHIHGGMYIFTHPVYLPIDPDLIKNIMATEFQYFRNRGLPHDAKNDPLSGHLLNLDGDPWKNMRLKLAPTFTSGKIKMMFQTVLDCSDPMINYLNNKCQTGTDLDIQEIVQRYLTDVIGSSAFGIECNSFKNPNVEFRTYGHQFLDQATSCSFAYFIAYACSPSSRFIFKKRINKDVEHFFTNAIKNIIDYRTVNNIKRNDFVQLLMTIMEKNKHTKHSLSLGEMVAQSCLFFAAGFETSSITMSFCLHELAFNQDIQDRLREEIQDTLNKYHGTFTYDGIMQMKYMDQVINEILRKYPPAPLLVRVCTKDYKVPNTDVIIEEGTTVVINVFALHRNEEYYPDPEKFDPERFNETNKATRQPFTFMPFGEGPRICIGTRFAMMQVKTGLAILLSNYIFFPATGANYEINYRPLSFLLSSREPLMLRAEKI